MKKVYLVMSMLLVSAFSFGQFAIPVPGGDMESWRNNTAGSTSAVAIHAPNPWYGFDSLIIANGELFLAGHNWYAQLFQEATIKNGGTSAARLISKKQDTSLLGVIPGSLSNAKASVNVFTLLSTHDINAATTFTGGTAVGARVTSVSAYVQYWPGIDTTTHLMGGHDTGSLSVLAYSTVHGVDTLVGTGYVLINPSTSFSQVTANVVYADTLDTVNTVRIIFSSSAASYSLDSSTLFVDDITMMGVPNYHAPVPPPPPAGVKNASYSEVKVYPNPTNGIVYFNATQAEGLQAELLSVSGQAVARQVLTGNDAMNISYLPTGLYFYNIIGPDGGVVQRGKVNLVR